MGSYPAPDALVLVAILPAQRDLEIARLFGWYRIPLRHAPKVVAVDSLAFYQTGAFEEQERWQILRFAAVRGHELTTRRELFREEADHPRAAEEYYKIQIGPLQSLERPLPAERWKRITFFYTTGAHFQTAKTIRDLVVRSEEREVLWRSLRERALANGQYQAGDLPEFALDPAILALLAGSWHSVGENKMNKAAGDW